MLIASLLNELHGDIHILSQQFLQRVAGINSDAHLWLLQLLAGNMHEADSKPQHCQSYYDMFAWTVALIPKQSQEVQCLHMQTNTKHWNGLHACICVLADMWYMLVVCKKTG